jgi:hypothetical protein
MGVWVVPKEDWGLSSGELVYGQALRLSGQPTLSTSQVAERAATMPAVQPALPTRLFREAIQPPRVRDQLEGATHVYVSIGTKSSLFHRRTACHMWCGGVVGSLSPSSSAAGQRQFLSTASRCTWAERSLYRQYRPRAAARDKSSQVKILFPDPLPETTACQRIFWGAPVERGIIYI